MSQDNNRRQNDGKTGQGYNFLLVAIVFAIAILFGVLYLVNAAVLTIGPNDLKELVSSENKTVFVKDGEKEYRYTDPTEVIVGTSLITGQVKRSVQVEGTTQRVDEQGNLVLGDDGEPIQEKKFSVPELETFRTYNDPKDSKWITDLLEKSDIKWSLAPPPGLWRAYGPVLLVSALFVLLFLFLLRRLGGAGSPMAFWP